MENWRANIEKFEHNEMYKYTIIFRGKTISFNSFIEALKTSTKFRFFFNELLSKSKFNAYFWEVKPISQNNMDQEFEFVIINSASLKNIKSNDSSFLSYFSHTKKVVSFKNLRKDAILVVPTPIESNHVYSHLAKFVRNASKNQVDEFWKMVAIEYANSLNEKPSWLSTHGLGVHWLHIRIDSIPKYYHYTKYKTYNH